MRPDRFAPLPPDVAASLLDGLSGEEDWRLILPYVPDARRAAALAILALMHELSGVPARVSEPMMGAIRCQWWRDVLEEVFGGGMVRAHPLARALGRTLGDLPASREPLDAMIDGAEAVLEADAPTTLDAALGLATPLYGNAATALARSLGAETRSSDAGPQAALHAVLRHRGCRTPRERTRSLPRLAELLADTDASGIEDRIRAARSTARRMPAEAVPAVLPTVLLSRYAEGRDPSPIGKRARYFTAVLRGRV